MKSDQDYMELALELAKKGEGRVNPNPLVGAVVVLENQIVGKGYHQYFGGAHAEVYALEEAGEKAKGATLYVTLEPCSHMGKTPPCVKKVIESGIKCCVIAMLDPNPLVAGRGLRALKEAGIQVEVGLCEAESKRINRIFCKYISTKIPFVFLKCAITLDGKLATRRGVSKWISNELARERVQILRNQCMGIMIGIDTLLWDNPSLDCRMQGGRHPIPIIVDPYLKIPLDAKSLELHKRRYLIVTSVEEKENVKIASLKEKGIEFIFLEGRQFFFSDMLKKIGQLGIDSVLLEGGGKLISSAFQEQQIDAGEIFVAPKILGDGEAVPFVSGFMKETMEEAIELPHVTTKMYGDNISFSFYYEERKCLQD